VDAELAVDAGEVRLDRVHADEQGCCDLLVRATFGRERGDSRFRLRQLGRA
jgi:hypothetical protein